VIAGFKDKDVEVLFTTRVASKRLAAYAETALRKLLAIHGAKSVTDLALPPGNQLKKVTGTKNTYQVRIDQQYRVRFTWDGHDAHDVQIGDFH